LPVRDFHLLVDRPLAGRATFQVHRTAAVPQVHISAADDHLTGFAGLLLSGELIRRTRLVARIDGAVEAVRPFKQRHRGRSAGELLVVLAEAMMAGGNHLAHLEVLRQDTAGLRAVADTPPPTTAGQLLRRLSVPQLRAAIAATAQAGNRLDTELGRDAAAPVTLDIDATTTEVYGRQKRGAAFNYEGRFSYKSQLVTWAERYRVLAVELNSGNTAAKPSAPLLLDEALGRLPQGHGQVSVRGDSDYFCDELMQRCRRRRVRFAISVPRNRAMWRASYQVPEQGWRPALEMPGAEIAETTYSPLGWTHAPLRLLIRRRLLEVAELGNRRAQRRRTVPQLQLQLALNGSVSQVYGYSFILTDMGGEATEIELWQRQRAHIEERIKDAKLGCGLIHLPLGTLRANRGWQAAAVIAVNLVAMLSAVLLDTLPKPPTPDPDDVVDDLAEGDDEPSHRLASTVRRWMIAAPGRLTHSGRRLHLHLPRGWLWAERIIAVYARLRRIPLVT
jgi:hypothetical protein